MQGLWKNKVSGWKKDSKRKKQKFKHFMRDKKDFVIKRIFKNDLKELEVVLFEKVFYEKSIKNYDLKLSYIIYNEALIEAWTMKDNEEYDLIWFDKNFETILSRDGTYINEFGFKRNIKVVGTIKCIKPNYFLKEKRENFKLENTKYFYKGHLLSKQIYCPDKYYYYGSYSENVSTPRSIIKQHLKNADYDFVPIKKSVIIYG